MKSNLPSTRHPAGPARVCPPAPCRQGAPDRNAHITMWDNLGDKFVPSSSQTFASKKKDTENMWDLCATKQPARNKDSH